MSGHPALARATAALTVAALLALVPAVAIARPTHLELKEERLNEGLGQPPAQLDRSTARRAWDALVRSCESKSWEGAAHLLNLGEIKTEDQRELGAALARKLCAVLQAAQQLVARPDLSDAQLGPLVGDKPANYVVAARVALPDGKAEEVWLRRIKDKVAGKESWVVTRQTLSLVGDWHRRIVRGESGGPQLTQAAPNPISQRLDLSNPRAVATKFRELTKGGQYEQAGQLLDLRGIAAEARAKRGAKLARRLALVLSRIHPGGFHQLSNDAKGAPEKDVPDDQEVVARVKLAQDTAQVRLQRYARATGAPVWLFSTITVDEIDQLYQHHGYGWAGDILPPVFFKIQVWNVQLWQWIGIGLGALAALLFGYIFSFFTRKLLLKLAKLTSWDWDDRVVAAMKGPLNLVFFAVGMLALTGLLALAETPQGVMLRLCKLLVILGGGWFFVRAVDVAGEIIHDFFQKRGDELAMAMVPVARRIVKPIMVLLVLIVALQNAGMNVAGLLAGLGIGGLALAMAAKTTVENMLGGITIAFDRPFKVGDFVRVGDLLGTVEEVGLRSTRVRTLDRTMVSIPNGQMVDSRVENFAKRDRIWLTFTIGVQYDTSIDQVRYIIDEMNRALLQHPRIYHDVLRVRFSAFGASSLDIETFTYVTTTDYTEFTGIREEIYMIIADIVERAGAQFAFPSRTVYMGKAADADTNKAKAASAHIAELITAGEYTLPMIPEKVRERLSPKKPNYDLP